MDSKLIEELSLNNWPTLTTLFYDGWMLRFANGYTFRSNSVSSIYESSIDTEQKINYCEQLYTKQRQHTVFKITPHMHPENLDQILEQKGYSIMNMANVHTLKLNSIKQPKLASCQIIEEPDAEWIENFSRLSGVESPNKKTMLQLLSNIRTKAGYISFYYEGRALACGLGVIERDYIGLYDIVTDKNFRNQGIAEQMILNLLHWGKDNGAAYSYLAVLSDNLPALRLYSKLGYKEIYKYWYRVKEYAD
ncbi:GNAT family N-acetyltransferase [Paenibacillus pinihumi]|uniref:GNAT family N-acetyltransferase n=1 Tax=Paenibacillus pinihumi TaxID=669462 RepID=UPI00040EE84C|nr:GNAT family N-acetyltransferase [Paenibacillus pinihumi]